MILAPLLIILALTIAGFIFFGSASTFIFGIPSGFHDVYYLLILAASISCRNRYVCVVSWFIASVFVSSIVMQIADLRPVGEAGGYDLFLDNISNAILSVSLFLSVYFLPKLGYINECGRVIFVRYLSLTFLALNLLLTFKGVRELFANYATIYDYIFYLYLYAVCFSANNSICDAVRRSSNHIVGLLHPSGIRKLQD